MYEIENKKLMAKKKEDRKYEEKKSVCVCVCVCVWGKHKVSETLRVQLLFGIQLIVKGKLCFLFNLL